jgi:DnaJ homologue, subfamily C, member 28, conserved domain
MTGSGDGRRKPKGSTWESWVDRQIRDGIERGDFENLPGKGKPLDGIGADGVDSRRDEDWWLKAKLRRERLSYLPTTLAVRKEVEEALEAIGRASNEHVVRRILADINQRIRDVNRRGADGPPSTVMPLDEDAVVDRWRTQHNTRGA